MDTENTDSAGVRVRPSLHALRTSGWMGTLLAGPADLHPDHARAIHGVGGHCSWPGSRRGRRGADPVQPARKGTSGAPPAVARPRRRGARRADRRGAPDRGRRVSWPLESTCLRRWIAAVRRQPASPGRRAARAAEFGGVSEHPGESRCAPGNRLTRGWRRPARLLLPQVDQGDPHGHRAGGVHRIVRAVVAGQAHIRSALVRERG